MKRYLTILLISVTFAIVFAFGSITISASDVPSQAAWFQQSGFEFDSTSKAYTIHLKWRHGIIDENYPKAEGYYVYRSMIGHEEEIENYELAGIVTDDEDSEGFILFSDEVTLQGGYFYYLKGFIGDDFGEMSVRIQAFSLTSYCVNLDAEIVDFISFPNTVATAGVKYQYEAYARHRSVRVQGFVRYNLLEGPEGMQIDNKTGLLTWDIPNNAEGEFYVEISATSEEDPRAESIQQWYIRIANDWDLLVTPTSFRELRIETNIQVYPNPASDYIEISFGNIGLQPPNSKTIVIYNVLGNEVAQTFLSVVEQASPPVHIQAREHRIDISHLPGGVYFVRVGNGIQFKTGKFNVVK